MQFIKHISVNSTKTFQILFEIYSLVTNQPLQNQTKHSDQSILVRYFKYLPKTYLKSYMCSVSVLYCHTFSLRTGMALCDASTVN